MSSCSYEFGQTCAGLRSVRGRQLLAASSVSAGNRPVIGPAAQSSSRNRRNTPAQRMRWTSRSARTDTRAGTEKLTRERAAYFELMRRGLRSQEACRIVGIDVRTGKKWRNGHHSPGIDKKVVPPIYREAPPSGLSRYLREYDRILIADRLREKSTACQVSVCRGLSAFLGWVVVGGVGG